MLYNLMEIRPVGFELFHVDGQTDRHDEANSRISNIVNAPKNSRRISKAHFH